MEGAVYLCGMPSILGLSIEHSNTPLQYEAFGTACTAAVDPAPLESCVVSVYILLSSLLKPVNLARIGKSGPLILPYFLAFLAPESRLRPSLPRFYRR